MSFVILIRLQLELVDHWLHWIRLIHLTWTWLNWQLFFNLICQFDSFIFFVIYLVWLTTLNFAAVWLMATPTRALRMNPHWAEEILSVRKDLELKKSEFLWFRLRVLNLINLSTVWTQWLRRRLMIVSPGWATIVCGVWYESKYYFHYFYTLLT